MITTRRRGIANIALLVGIPILAVVLIALGVGLARGISTLFLKRADMGFGDSAGALGKKISNVLFMGDSITYGYAGGYADQNSFTSQTGKTIRDEMKNALSSLSVQMDAVGVGSMNTEWILNNEVPVMNNGNFDAVVLMTGFNDSGSPAAPAIDNFQKIVSAAQEKDISVFVLTLYKGKSGANAIPDTFITEFNNAIKAQSGVTVIELSTLDKPNEDIHRDYDKIQVLVKDAIKKHNDEVGEGFGGGPVATGNNLPVPLYDQRTKWGNYPKGGKFCGVTSVKMALDYYAKLNYHIRDLDGLNDASYKQRYVLGWHTQQAWSHFLTSASGKVDQRLDANDWLKVRTSLANGHPLISYGSWTFNGGHIVVIIGISDTHVTIADPWKGVMRSFTKAQASNYLVGRKYSYAGHSYHLYNKDYEKDKLR